MKAAAAIAAGFALLWIWANHRRASTEHRPAAVASELAGLPVGVIRNEAQAQCRAVRADAWAAARLGATAAQAEAVARYALALQPALPSEYRFGVCAAGGADRVSAAACASRPWLCQALPER